MEVNSPKGIIKAHAVEDEYPGIWISIGNDENKLVLVEYDASIENFAIRVWDHKQPEDDFIYKQIVDTNYFTSSEYKEALSKEFDDITQDEYGTWTQICRHCAESLKVPEDKLSNGGENMLCGTRSCTNEADYYFDITESKSVE